MDGKIIIGTEIDTSGFDEQINNIEQTSVTKEIDVEANTDDLDLEETIKRADDATDGLVSKLSEALEEYKELTSDKDVITSDDISKTEELKQQIIEMVRQLEKQTGMRFYIKGITDFKNEVDKVNKKHLPNLKKNFNGIGNSIGKITKKVVAWGLAIFGIRSAYSMVRQAINTISSQDQQLKADIDYMKNAIAYTLEPLVRWIVDLAKQLMIYIGNITKKLTGKNIFENANKSLQSANKNAKELSKTIAGFDEMNVVNDNSSGSETTNPSFDLTIDESPFKDWKISDFVNKGKEIAKNLAKGINDFFKNTDFKALAQQISEGLRGSIQTITTFLEEVDWSQIGYSIWEFFMNIDWVGLAIDIIDMLVAGIIGSFDLLMGAMDAVIDAFSDPEFLNNVYEAGGKLLGKLVDGMIALIGKLWDFYMKMFELFGVLLGLIWDLLVDFGKLLFEWGKGIVEWIYNHIIKPIGDFFTNLWNGIIQGVRNAVQWVKDIFWSIVGFFSNIINTILGFFRDIGTKVGDAISGAFKAVVNGVLSAIETILNFPIRAVNKLIDVINAVPGIDIGKLNEFNLPRLERGGIVHNPGQGVMMGSYIAGEGRDAEAVLPLNDETLDRLGYAFARHTVINANITNTMNGRVISRELQKIQNESDFAFNR